MIYSVFTFVALTRYNGAVARFSVLLPEMVVTNYAKNCGECRVPADTFVIFGERHWGSVFGASLLFQVSAIKGKTRE